MIDQQIIEQIYNGNDVTLSIVYEQYRDEFVMFAHKHYDLDMDSGMDIYQESFYAFYKNIQTGKLKQLTSSIKTYLFEIGKNQIFNELRRREKEKEIIAFDSSPDLLEKIAEEEVETEKSTIVRNLVRTMQEPCSTILKMFYWQQKKYDEMFYLLEYSSIESLKTQKYKCMKKLEITVRTKFKEANLL
jgi:RNA polymerase sigma-70 factor (ECF subfamily)